MVYNEKYPTDVVIDLETLGTKPGCVILSMGAYAINSPLGARASFYDTLAGGDQEALGLVIDPKTVEWWHKQDPGVRLEAFSGRAPLLVVLEGFAKYLAQFNNFRVWGNSASFDLGILAHTYEVAGIKVPWTYWQEMCYRTAKAMFQHIGVPAKPVVAHNALDDAISEALHLELILEVIRNGLS